jgi:hypothetical protein
LVATICHTNTRILAQFGGKRGLGRRLNHDWFGHVWVFWDRMHRMGKKARADARRGKPQPNRGVGIENLSFVIGEWRSGDFAKNAQFRGIALHAGLARVDAGRGCGGLFFLSYV